ncbi:MAG: hypothetical protein LH473_00855 [Chitinophagales bacterium]|nr:hypothetical protein [Chitinophagales bacterium]
MRLKPDGSVRWSRTFDAISKNDQAFAVEQTRDNNYFIACGSSQNDHFNPVSTASTDLWVIKLNLDGTTVSGWTTTWSSIVHQGKFYGSTGAGFGDPDIGYDFKEDLNGNFVIVGRVGSKNHDVGSGNNVQGDGDIWVLKISSSGTKLKDTVYHGAYSGLDFARSVTVDCGTGHYIVSGFCTSCESNSTNTELIFLDISSDFDSMSVHTYGNPNYDHGSFNVIQPGTICLL